MPDNLRKLYDNVSAEYELPDFETFKLDMSDDVKRQKLYDAIAADYELPDFETFTADMGVKKKEPSEPVSQVGSDRSQIQSQKEAESVRRLTAKAVAGDKFAQQALESYAAKKKAASVSITEDTETQQQFGVQKPAEPVSQSDLLQIEKPLNETDRSQAAPNLPTVVKPGSAKDFLATKPAYLDAQKQEIEAMSQHMGNRTAGITFSKIKDVEPGKARVNTGEPEFKLLEDDYLDYLQATDPQMGESKRNELIALRQKEKDGTLSDAEAKAMLAIRNEAIDAHNLVQEKVIWDVKGTMDSDRYQREGTVLSQKIKSLDEKMAGMNVTQDSPPTKIAEYNALVEQRNALVDEFANLEKETGFSEEKAFLMLDASEKMIGGDADRMQRMNMRFPWLQTRENERATRSNMRYWEAGNGGPLTWLVGLNEEFVNTIGGMMTSVAQLPKVLGDATGDTDYDIWDDLYNDINSLKWDRASYYGQPQAIGLGEVPKYEDLPLMYRMSRMLGSGLGSVAVFAAGGEFAAAANIPTSLGTFGASFLTTTSDLYEEALATGLNPKDAATTSTMLSAILSTIEASVADIELVDPAKQYRKSLAGSVIKSVNEGVPFSQALKLAIEALPDSFRSYKNAFIQEGAEEGAAQLASDVSKEVINIDEGVARYTNLWSGEAYKEAVLAGVITSGFLNAFNRPHPEPYSPLQEEFLNEAAKNAPDGPGPKTNVVDLDAQTQQWNSSNPVLARAREIRSSLEVSPTFKSLRPELQNHVVAEIFRKEGLQKSMKEAGVPMADVEAEIARIDEEVKTILDTGKTPTELSEEANKAKAEPQEAAVEVEFNVMREQSKPVTELVGQRVVMNGVEGDLVQTGDVVQFETADKIIDLGTTEEVADKKAYDFDIREAKSDVKVTDGGFEVRGKAYTNEFSKPENAVNRDKEGNIVSVTLTNDKGKPVTFRGVEADELAFEILRPMRGEEEVKPLESEGVADVEASAYEESDEEWDLIAQGERPESSIDAIKAFDNGYRVFIAQELDGSFTEATSSKEIESATTSELYMVGPDVLPTKRATDETQAQGDTEVDGGIRPTITEGEVGQGGEGLQPAVDVAAGEGEVEVKREPRAEIPPVEGTIEENPFDEIDVETESERKTRERKEAKRERNAKINELLYKKNRFNSLPKKARASLGNVLKQIQEQAEALGLDTRMTGSGVAIVNPKTGKQILPKGIKRTPKKEGPIEQQAMRWYNEPERLFQPYNIALSYFAGGGMVNTKDSEVNPKEQSAYKRQRLISDKAPGVNDVALGLVADMLGSTNDTAYQAQLVDDVTAALQQVLLTHATRASMRNEIVSEYEEAMKQEPEGEMTAEENEFSDIEFENDVDQPAPTSFEDVEGEEIFPSDEEAPFQRDDKLIEARANAIREEQKKLVDQRKRVEQSKAKKVKEMSKEAQKEIGNLFDQGVIGDPNSLFQEGIDFSKDNVQSVLNKYNAEIEQINRQLAALQKELDGLGQDSGQLDMFGEPMAQMEGLSPMVITSRKVKVYRGSSGTGNDRGDKGSKWWTASQKLAQFFAGNNKENIGEKTLDVSGFLKIQGTNTGTYKANEVAEILGISVDQLKESVTPATFEAMGWSGTKLHSVIESKKIQILLAAKGIRGIQSTDLMDKTAYLEFSENILEAGKQKAIDSGLQQDIPDDFTTNGGNKIVDENGNPLKVYHGTTTNDFVGSEFVIGWDVQGFGGGAENIGVFFGNMKQAKEVSEGSVSYGAEVTGKRIIPAYINLRNPLRLKKDAKFWFSTERVLDALKTDPRVNIAELQELVKKHEAKGEVFVKKPVTATEELKVENDTVAQVIRPYLQQKGFDGIVYDNEVDAVEKDGESSGESYIVFDPKDIIIDQAKAQPQNEQKIKAQFPDASDAQVKRVTKVVNKIVNALKQIRPDITSVVYKKDEDFIAAAIAAGMKPGTANTAKSFFDPRTGTLHISASRMSENTPFHEGAHPVLTVLAAENPETIGHFARQVENLRKADGRTYRAWAESGYPGASDTVRDTEILAEFLGDVATGRHADQFGKSWFRELVAWLKSLLGKIGLQQEIDLDSAKDLREFAQRFSEAMRWGVRAHMQFAQQRRRQVYAAQKAQWQNDADQLVSIDAKIAKMIAAGKTPDEISEMIRTSTKGKAIAQVVRKMTGKSVGQHVADMYNNLKQPVATPSSGEGRVNDANGNPIKRTVEDVMRDIAEILTAGGKDFRTKSRAMRWESNQSALPNYQKLVELGSNYIGVDSNAVNNMAQMRMDMAAADYAAGNTQAYQQVFEEAKWLFEQAADAKWLESAQSMNVSQNMAAYSAVLASALSSKLATSKLKNRVELYQQVENFIDSKGRNSGTFVAFLDPNSNRFALERAAGKMQRRNAEILNQQSQGNQKIGEAIDEAAQQVIPTEEEVAEAVTTVKAPKAKKPKGTFDPDKPSAKAKKRANEADKKIKDLLAKKKSVFGDRGPGAISLATDPRVQFVAELAGAYIEKGVFRFVELSAKVYENIRDVASRAESDEIFRSAWRSGLREQATEAQRQAALEKIGDAVASGQGGKAMQALAKAILMTDSNYLNGDKKVHMGKKKAIETLLSNPQKAVELLYRAKENLRNLLEIGDPETVRALIGSTPSGWTDAEWKEARFAQVMQEMDALIDDVQGIEARVQSEAELQDFIKAIVKEHYDAMRSGEIDMIDQKGLTGKLVAAGLSPEEAKIYARQIVEAVEKKVEARAKAAINKLIRDLGPMGNENNIRKAFVRAVLMNGNFAGIQTALARKLAEQMYLPQHINQIVALAGLAQSLPQSQVKNWIATRGQNIVALYDESAGRFVADMLKGIAFRNLLGNPKTAILTGGLAGLLTIVPNAAKHRIINAKSYKGAKEYRKMLKASNLTMGSEAIKDIFRHSEGLITRELQKPGTVQSRDNAWKRAREATYKELRTLRRQNQPGLRSKAGWMMAMKIVQDLTFQGDMVRFKISGKTYDLSPVNFFVNLMTVIDSLVFSAHSDYLAYIQAANEVEMSGTRRDDPAFREKVLDKLGVSPEPGQTIEQYFDSVRQEAEAEAAQMALLGRAVPEDFVRQRTRQILQERSDQNVVTAAMDSTEEAMLLDDPKGAIGASLGSAFKWLANSPWAEDKDKISVMSGFTEVLFSLIFAFHKTGFNLMNKKVKGLPVYNVLSAVFPYRVRPSKVETPAGVKRSMFMLDSEGNRMNKWKSNPKDAAFQTSAAVILTTAFFYMLDSLFDYEEEKDKDGKPIINPTTGETVKTWKYKPSPFIDFHGSKAKMLKNQKEGLPARCIEFPFIEDPDRRFWSLDWLPPAMQAWFGLMGEMADDIRFNEDVKRYTGDKAKVKMTVYDEDGQPSEIEVEVNAFEIEERSIFTPMGIAMTGGLLAMDNSFSGLGKAINKVKYAYTFDKAMPFLVEALAVDPAQNIINPVILEQIENEVYYLRSRDRRVVSVKDANAEDWLNRVFQGVWFTDPFVGTGDNNEYILTDSFGLPYKYKSQLNILAGMFSSDIQGGFYKHSEDNWRYYDLYRNKDGEFDPAITPPKPYIYKPGTTEYGVKEVIDGDMQDKITLDVANKWREHIDAFVYGNPQIEKIIVEMPLENRSAILEWLRKLAIYSALKDNGFDSQKPGGIGSVPLTREQREMILAMELDFISPE
jgi:hypothetical protein